MNSPDSRGTFKGGNVSIEPPLSANSPTASATVIWLDALVRSLDLPLYERQQIRLELQSHIEDRVRDLILEGTDEGEATRRALSECGEASSLASGFSEVKKALRRRTLMNIGVVGAACGLVALGLGSLRNVTSTCPPEELAAMQQAQAAAAVSEAQAAAAVAGKARSRAYAAQATYALALPIAPTVTGPSVEFKDESIESVLQAISKEAGQPVLVNWSAILAGGVERNAPVSVKMPMSDPAAAIEFLNEVIGNSPESGPGPLAIRQRSDGLEIVSTAWLDKREAKLVIYDISATAENGVNPPDLQQAITQFIEPTNWKENGGDRAEMTLVGNRLLVKAPARIHEGVKWMITQFDGTDAESESTLSQPAWSLRRNIQELTPMPAASAGEPEKVVSEPGHPSEPAQPVEPTEPAEATPSQPVVLTLPMQHSQADLVAQLMQVVTSRTDHPLRVEITVDAGTNGLIFSGAEADSVKCQQIAAVIDSALGGSAVVTAKSVPVLGSLPLLNQLFSAKSASLTLSDQVEIRSTQPANDGSR